MYTILTQLYQKFKKLDNWTTSGSEAQPFVSLNKILQSQQRASKEPHKRALKRLFECKRVSQLSTKPFAGRTVNKKVNGIIEDVEDLAYIQCREHVKAFHERELMKCHAQKKQWPRYEIRQIDDGVGERHEQEHSCDLVVLRFVWLSTVIVVAVCTIRCVGQLFEDYFRVRIGLEQRELFHQVSFIAARTDRTNCERRVRPPQLFAQAYVSRETARLRIVEESLRPIRR